LAKDGEETADCYGKVVLAEPMVGLGLGALRAGEAPESFLCSTDIQHRAIFARMLKPPSYQVVQHQIVLRRYDGSLWLLYLVPELNIKDGVR
jgi:hypothetical protein